MSVNETVSVILAIRNEAKNIALVLEALKNQSFSEFELIVIDGLSTDGSMEVVQRFAAQEPRIKVLVNPYRKKSPGLNIGIRMAIGRIIVFIDGHAIPAENFLTENVHLLSQTGADCVGGLAIPRGRTLIERCFVQVLSSWFGSGGARFRYSDKEGQVDTVPYGAYRKHVFDRIGLMREDLDRNMDIEFNARLKRSGGRIYFSPDIRTYYQVRARLQAFLQQAFANGFWNVKTTYLVPGSLSWRHFIPLGFVTGLLASLIVSLLVPFGWIGFALILLPYSALDLHFTWKAFRRERHMRFLWIMPFVYFLFHLSYGFGSFCSLLTLPLSIWKMAKKGLRL